MRNELTVKIGLCEKKCIIGNGFFSSWKPTRNVHKHNYSEIHIITGGIAVFRCGKKRFSLQGGCVMAVPADTLHVFEEFDDGLYHTAFLIDGDISKFSIHNVSEGVLSAFFLEIENLEKTGNYTKIAAFIALLCSDFFKESRMEADRITDHAFIINNYFSMNYRNNVTLSDLAGELHFSDKQTERLVKQYTGMTFKQALISYRMIIAEYLSETTEMSLLEIAHYVGYRSYNGFWKAFTKYNAKHK